MRLPAEIQFADPWVLWLLPALLLLALVVARLRPGQLRGGAVLATLRPVLNIRPSRRQRVRALLPLLRLLALALLVVALARPQKAQADARVESEGIDIVLAFDISGSMQEQGLGARTKMEAAKTALKDFITGRENDRVGLVVFKSEARVMAPLTLDYQALAQQIDDVERQNEFLSDGTAVGLGVATSLNVIRNSPKKTRIIILATDGQSNSGEISPDQSAALAETLKIRVYTIGMVTANARPEATLDEREMRRLSERTGGAYARATNVSGLSEIYDNIANLEKSRFERERLTRYIELVGYLLIPSLGLLLLELVLAATWLRKAP